MTHPLIEAVLTVDMAARTLMRHASTNEKAAASEALTDLQVVANEVYVRDVANGYGELTPEIFQDVVKRAHEAGLPYDVLVAAFHKAQGTE